MVVYKTEFRRTLPLTIASSYYGDKITFLPGAHTSMDWNGTAKIDYQRHQWTSDRLQLSDRS